MPKLPTIVSDRNIYTGSTGAQARASDFYGGGLEDIARGIGNVGDVALRVSAAKVARKERDDNNEIQIGLNQLERDAQDFFNKNQDSTNLAEQFEEFFNRRASELGGGLVGQSAKKWQISSGNLFNRNNPVIQDRTQRNANAKTLAVANDTIDTGLAMLRSPSPLLPPYETAVRAFDDAVGHLETQWKGMAKETVARSRSDYEKKTFAGLLETDISAAEKFVQQRVKDPDDRLRYMAELARIKPAVNESASTAARRVIEGTRDAAMAGALDARQYPEPFYVAAYGESAGKTKYAEDRLDFQFAQRGAEFAGKVTGLNEQAQLESLRTLDEQVKAGIPGAELTRKVAMSLIDKSIEQQRSNPARWLVENNPVVSLAASNSDRLRREYLATTDGPAKQVALESYRESNGMLLSGIAKYSGKAPLFDFDGNPLTPQESAQYLGNPDGALDFMDKVAAKKTVQDILMGSPEQVQSRILSELSYYPPEYHAAVYNQLVRAGLPDEYQALMVTVDDPELNRTMQSALKQRKEPVPEFSIISIDNAVRANPTVKAWVFGMTAPGPERVEQSMRMTDGLTILAKQLLRDGKAKSEQDAAQKAADKLIGEHFMTGSVNGKGLFLSKKKPDGTPYTADEQDIIFSNLDLALYALDVEEINLQNFPSTEVKNRIASRITGDEQIKKQALSELWEDINKNGIWVPDGDGAGVSLWYPAGHGYGSVTTKDGKQIRLRLKDIPEYKVQLMSGENDAAINQTFLRLQQGGMTGFGNLFNPFSPYNIFNRTFGEKASEFSNIQSDLKIYFGNPKASGFWSSNYPEWNARNALKAATKGMK